MPKNRSHKFFVLANKIKEQSKRKERSLTSYLAHEKFIKYKLSSLSNFLTMTEFNIRFEYYCTVPT